MCGRSYRPCAAQLRGVPVRPGSIDGPVRSAASQCSQMRWHVTRGERTRPYWPWRAGQREGEAPPVGSDAAEGWRTARRRSLSASHRAADGAGPSIEPARTYAHGISTGPAVAVSCAWPRWETAAGLVCAVWRRDPVGESVGVEKLLRMGATRWLCSVHRPERSAWLDHYPRDLFAPARCADLPPAARAGGQHWPRRRAGSSQFKRSSGRQ
jgi:hypothetical protein